MPFNTEVLKGVQTALDVVIVTLKFETDSKLQVQREFKLVVNGEPFTDEWDYVGSLKFSDKQGIRFAHVLVGKQKSALSMSGLPPIKKEVKNAA